MSERTSKDRTTANDTAYGGEKWAVPDQAMQRRLASLGRADGRRGLPANDGSCPPALTGLAAQAEQLLERIGGELREELRAADVEIARAEQRLRAAEDELAGRAATLTEAERTAERTGEEADRQRVHGLRALTRRAEQQRKRREEEVATAVSDRAVTLAAFRHRSWQAVRFFESAAQIYADANLRARRAPRLLARWLPRHLEADDDLPAPQQFALAVRLPTWLQPATDEPDAPQPAQLAVSRPADDLLPHLDPPIRQ